MKNNTKTNAPSEITLKNVVVSLEWREGNGVGYASHTVKSADLDDGTADGPCDGEEFTLGNRRFFLGEHDYETSGDETTCTAEIYERRA